MSVIDASVYVALLKPDEPGYGASWAWLHAAVEAREPVFAPVIILPEVAAALARGVGDPELAGTALRGLLRSKIVQLQPVSLELGARAAELCASHGLRGCDGIYLALAESLGESLVTLDCQQLERGAAAANVFRPGE